MLDCIPDASHTEQTTFIVKCVSINTSHKQVNIRKYFFYSVTDKDFLIMSLICKILVGKTTIMDAI